MGADRHLETHPGGFASRLGDFEWWLFRGVLVSRVVLVVGLGMILPDERSVHGGAVFAAIASAWSATLIWVAVPVIAPRRVYGVLRARPELVSVDVAVFAGLLMVGGGWRNPFYLYAWSPFGLASVVWSARRTAGLIVLGCALQVASFAGWHLGGWDPAAAHTTNAVAWVSPLLGYVIVGGLFAYVRRRFDDLAEASAAYDARAVEALAVTRAAAAAAEREEVAYRLHRRLRQVFPALGLRVAVLEEDARSDPAILTDLAALSAVANGADATLDSVLQRLRGERQDGTGGTGTFDSGPGPSGFVR